MITKLATAALALGAALGASFVGSTPAGVGTATVAPGEPRPTSPYLHRGTFGSDAAARLPAYLVEPVDHGFSVASDAPSTAANDPATAFQSLSATVIDIGSVLNPDDEHGGTFLHQPVDHPVRPAARREIAGQLTAKRLTDSTRIVAERSVAELPYREGDRQGQLSFEIAPSGA